jgi:hypothetical protein
VVDAPGDIPVHNNLVIRNLPVQNMQAVRIFQYTAFSHQKPSSTKYAGSEDIPVQTNQSSEIFSVQNNQSNMQSVRIFKYTTLSHLKSF